MDLAHGILIVGGRGGIGDGADEVAGGGGDLAAKGFEMAGL
jgi:hypothetical protein